MLMILIAVEEDVQAARFIVNVETELTLEVKMLATSRPTNTPMLSDTHVGSLERGLADFGCMSAANSRQYGKKSKKGDNVSR